MPVISRGIDDIVIDRMVTALQAFSTREAAIAPAVAFNVERDRLRPPQPRELPLVNVWLESLTPADAGSGTRTAHQERARFNVDLYALGEEGAKTSDADAMARMYYLKEQVKQALYQLAQADFGFSAGVLARKPWPSFTTNPMRGEDSEERIADGRWIVELEYQWTPEIVDGLPLEEISVTTERFSALYEIGYYGS